MVEFAVVLPVLFMLTVALIDVGRGFYQYNNAANAVREAARFASVAGGSQGHPDFDWSLPGNAPGTYAQSSGRPASQYAGTSTIVGKLAAFAAGFDLDEVSVTITAPNGGMSWGSPIRVRLDYVFRPASALLAGGQSISISATSEMIIE